MALLRPSLITAWSQSNTSCHCVTSLSPRFTAQHTHLCITAAVSLVLTGLRCVSQNIIQPYILSCSISMKLPQSLLIFKVLLLYLAPTLQQRGRCSGVPPRSVSFLFSESAQRSGRAPGWRERRDGEGSERCSCAVRAGDGAPRPTAARTEPAVPGISPSGG